MKDLISRKMAIDAVEKKIRYTDYDEPVVDWNDFVAALCFLPSVQPKGNWLGSYCPYTCNQCGKTSDSRTPFCRYCGADMRE